MSQLTITRDLLFLCGNNHRFSYIQYLRFEVNYYFPDEELTKYQ